MGPFFCRTADTRLDIQHRIDPLRKPGRNASDHGIIRCICAVRIPETHRHTDKPSVLIYPSIHQGEGWHCNQPSLPLPTKSHTNVKLLLSFLLSLASLTLGAQTFSQHLKETDAGGGSLVVVQSAEIEKALDHKKLDTKGNGKNSSSKPGKNTGKDNAPSQNENNERGNDHNSPQTNHSAKPTRMMGYRIQIYSGPRNEGQIAARKMEAKCKKALPGLATYVKFIQPRWTCRVGDFQTHQDAEVFVKKIREADISSQITIVRSEIFKVY